MRTQSNVAPILAAAALVALASLCPTSLEAQVNDSGRWYIRGDAGLNILQDVGGLVGNGVALGGPGQFISFTGNPATSQPVPAHPTMEFDAGPRMDLSLGYNLRNNLAIEVETGFSYNTLNRFAGLPVSSGSARIALWQVPLLLNGIYKYSFNDHWQAYGGLGIGGVDSTFEVSSKGASLGISDYQLAYQAMLGVKYLINPNWECGLGYKFLGTSSHDWKFSSSSRLQTSPTYSHGLLLSASYKF